MARAYVASEVLKALDNVQVTGSFANPCDTAMASAALIRRMGMHIEQLEASVDHLAKERDAAYLARDKLIEAHMRTESSHERDARAAMQAGLIGNPEWRHMKSELVKEAYEVADAMAGARALRKGSR